MKSHYISMKKVKDPLGFELETFRLQVKYQTHYATVSYIISRVDKIFVK